MISEYALDPALVARWHDPREWALFREGFADGTGRFGSTFPRQNAKKWRQQAMRAFRDLVPEATSESHAWRRFDALLDKLSERMVERAACDAADGPWLARAIEEHALRPFHGILSAQPAPGLTEVITPEMLFDDPPMAWRVPPCPPVPRTAEGFSQTLAPVLTRCREAVFVDPHFSPEKRRFREPLGAMLGVLWGAGGCVDAPKAQLVISEGEGDRRRDPIRLMAQCKDRLPAILPAGRRLTVTVIRQREGGQKIHNRYVLTKFFGVSFGTGLDAADHDQTGQTEDICRLSRDQLLERWGQYVSARGSHFHLAAGPEVISQV